MSIATFLLIAVFVLVWAWLLVVVTERMFRGHRRRRVAEEVEKLRVSRPID